MSDSILSVAGLSRTEEPINRQATARWIGRQGHVVLDNPAVQARPWIEDHRVERRIALKDLFKVRRPIGYVSRRGQSRLFDALLQCGFVVGKTRFGYALEARCSLPIKRGSTMNRPVEIDHHRELIFIEFIKMRQSLDRRQSLSRAGHDRVPSLSHPSAFVLFEMARNEIRNAMAKRVQKRLFDDRPDTRIVRIDVRIRLRTSRLEHVIRAFEKVRNLDRKSVV